jgi:hypothetical protein
MNMQQNKREKIKYFIIQKIMGIGLIILAIISCKVLEDGTASILLIPIGIYTILTKKMVITNTYYFNLKE